ncbi:MAG: exosome complex RNA-binding protein Csl4 [Thermoplasmata archaeon]|jgi:exosome complex component CSL4
MTPSEVPKFVVPGEYLGAAEEFVPGRGTYEHDGRIFSSLVGVPTVDPADRTVRVAPTNGVPTISEGDVVYARVDELKSAMAICTILSTTETRRGIPGAPEGTVHISKVRDGYTESLSTELAVGDVVIARVLQAHPSIKLSTAPSNLGVISARCQVCHGLMTVGEKALTCPRCGNREQRKLALGPRPSVLPS